MEGSPERITIEIDLGSLWVGLAEGSTFAEYVAGIAAQRLMSSKGAQEATGEYRRRALAIADEEIREQLLPVIAQALEASVQRTGPYGDPRGETKTLREVIVEAALDQLRKPQGDGFAGTRRGETLVQTIVRKEVEEALSAELRDAIRESRADVVRAVREKAAEIMAETIARVAEGRGVA